MIARKIDTIPFLILFLILSCKTNSIKKEEVNAIQIDSLTQEIGTIKIKNDSLSLEGNELKVSLIKDEIDHANQMVEYLESRRYRKKTNNFTIDFCYPFLKENINSKFKMFNEHVENEVLKIQEVEKDILESQELLCDTVTGNSKIEHRLIDYKVFLQNEKDVSVLFYLENHYANTKSSYYTFKTVNFNISKGKLLAFEDVFETESIDEVLDIINIEISTSIQNGDLFYECFTISKEDFKKAKNDFIIKNNTIIYYFNDCVMCPSFVGTYEIEISLERFIPILKENVINNFKI